MALQQRWNVAYHEAGHAVVARVLRCSFTAVSIDLEDGGCVWMRSQFRRMRPDIAPTTPQLRDAFEREYMACTAGRLAQERFMGHPPEGFEYEHDATVAEEMLQRVSARPAERRAYHRYLVERTRSELVFPPHWNAVHVLAGGLMQDGALRARAAVQIIDAAVMAEDAWRHGRRRRLATAEART